MAGGIGGIVMEDMGDLFHRPGSTCHFLHAAACGLVVWLAPIRAQATAPEYYFTTLAGAASMGSADGAANVARFNGPTGVAVDAAGNLYVADSGNYAVRKITPNGTVSTLAGVAGEPGRVDGSPAVARFSDPTGVAVDVTGNLYVADFNAIRRIATDGQVTTFAGDPAPNPSSGDNDGVGPLARFESLGGITIDPAGTLFVSDSGACSIRSVTTGAVVTTLAGTGPAYADGTGALANFFNPAGLAVDGGGAVYIADSHNRAIRKMLPGGIVTTLAGSPGVVGATDGVGAAATFNYPLGVAVDLSGKVYVADTPSGTIRAVTPSGLVTTLAGQAGSVGAADGAGATASFNFPSGLAVDAAGNLFVADSANNLIRKVTATGLVTTLAGLAPSQSAGAVDDLGVAARFSYPYGVAVTPAGVCYVADTGNHLIRKISPDGLVSTLAGAAGQSGHGDGAGSLARFDEPFDLALDRAGNLYVIDNSRTIRVVTPAGVVTTLAGNVDAPPYGYPADGQGLAAEFGRLTSIAVAPNGDIYMGERIQSAPDSTPLARLRKVTPAGIVTTVNDPPIVHGVHTVISGLAFDAAGTMYSCDSGYPTLDKVSATGTEGIPLNSFIPVRVAVDASGNVLLTEQGGRVGRVTAGGQLDIIGGQLHQQGHQDGIGPAALFYEVEGIAVDASGAIYVASGDHTIRKGVIATAPTIIIQPQNQTVVAGASVQLSVSAAAVPAPAYQWYFNGGPITYATGASLGLTSARAADAGDYTVVVTNALGSTTSAKAALTVTPPSPASGGGGSGSSGGGGAASVWFAGALAALGGARMMRGRFSAGSGR